MPQHLNPYDTGHRLEPHPWPTAGVTDTDKYGRVDFDDENGETVFNVLVQKTETGYILRAEEVQEGVAIAFETSSDREVRSEAMQKLDRALTQLGAHYAGAISYNGEGDPETFGLGHYVFEDDLQRHRLYITEQYAGTDSSDPDRIPNTWKVESDTRTTPQGPWEPGPEHPEYSPQSIVALIEHVDNWCNNRLREANAHAALRSPNPSHTQSAAQRQRPAM